MSKKVSILDLQQKKNDHQPITMLTAYDYPGAQLVDEAGVGSNCPALSDRK